jgi:hypothetical protein
MFFIFEKEELSLFSLWQALKSKL